jgi:alpha-tubulin N-acetyltransferase 1
LIGFLKKHYGLSGFIPQNNNYVIFDRFFSKIEKGKLPLSPKGSCNKVAAQKTVNSGSKVESKVDKNIQKADTVAI